MQPPGETHWPAVQGFPSSQPTAAPPSQVPPTHSSPAVQASPSLHEASSFGSYGGRWKVVPVTFDDYDAAVAAYDTNGSGNFDSAEEVEAAVAGGAASLGEVAASFECPVIPLPKGKGK